MASVLIVDDEELSRFAVRKLLSRLFPEVLVAGEAENGRVAVELARSLRPDLVLMDIRIPAMNGIEDAQAILAELPATKIIVLSAYDSFGFAQRAINIGVSGYLLKPVEEGEFQALFGAALAGLEPRPGSRPAGQGGVAARRPLYPFEEELSLFRAMALGEGVEAAAEAMLAALLRGGAEHYAERCLEFSASLKRELRSLGLPPEAAELAGYPSSSAIAGSADPAVLELALSRGLTLALAALETARGLGRRAAIERAIASLPLRELGLERVAERLGMSSQHLSRLFKEVFGLRFVEHSTNLRIEAAKAALAEEDIVVEELCRRLGWSDSAHFTKVFKERTGLTPRVYARSRRKG
jgi:two-component system, response regulator YesN